MKTKNIELELNNILYNFTINGWTEKTSIDPDNWSENNPAWGQCVITALIIQDIYGGELLRATVNNGISHYWNRLPNGKEIDLTRIQFNEFKIDSEPIVRDREYVLSFPDTKERYELLKERFTKNNHFED